MLKHQQKQEQRLEQRLSPQQIQYYKLLELSTLELEQRVKAEIEENPALEEGKDKESDAEFDETFEAESEGNNEDMTLGDYMSDDDIPPYKLEMQSEEKEGFTATFSNNKTFYDYLLEQLSLRDINERQHKLSEYLIGNIDEDGLLRRDLESIADDLAFREGIMTNTDELAEALETVQDLDPAGVGATSLQECLLLQIERKKATPSSTLAYTIIKEYFDDLSKRNFDHIVSRLQIERSELKEAMEAIELLNPKPANSWNESGISGMETITPDFLVETTDGEINLSLNNQNVPFLRVNGEYQQMMKDYVGNEKNRTRESTAAITFIKQKMDSAKWFVDSIKQRQETLLSVMRAIIQIQRPFFLSGNNGDLKPMNLKNVAEKCPYDISTISRVTSSKYVETNFGIFPLRFFFSDTTQTESGDDIRTHEVKEYLKECIDNENKQKPYTDEELVELLKQKGYIIARRTVAKYREQQFIPVARLRRQVE